jgi:hypothetical protein
MNNKALVSGIFCDLQKAFDCGNHKILIDKLESYGIEGKFKTLIKSYLMGRHQRAVLSNKSNNGSTSKWEMIKYRVPQGSILGPLLFLLYINDLQKILNKDNYMVLYADDTSIIITERDKTNFLNLNRTFKKINTWFSTQLLTLNLKKTHIGNLGQGAVVRAQRTLNASREVLLLSPKLNFSDYASMIPYLGNGK